jgi:hypothetical protein
MQGNADCCLKLSSRNDTVLHIAADTNVKVEQAQVPGKRPNGAWTNTPKENAAKVVPQHAVRGTAITCTQHGWVGEG